MLVGRSRECDALDQMLKAAREGTGQVMVVRGEPGVGKTALLEYVVAQSQGFRVERALGSESETELAFAGLHQLCAPMLGQLDRLPDSQSEALRVTFGIVQGAAPDRLMVGLAVLDLLSAVADETPLVCVIDDVQWIDQASTQVLEFVARRLFAEPLALVFAVREPSQTRPMSDLPELEVKGLSDDDSRTLLASAMRWPFDVEVRERFIAMTEGNPLALLELTQELTPSKVAGGFGLPSSGSLSSRIECGFLQRFAKLPLDTRRLVLIAATNAPGDSGLMWRAADRLGISPDAADAAVSAGLMTFGAKWTFRHPLVASAVYRSAGLEERREVHQALADATDQLLDPDRRVWHLAKAAWETDEIIASELEFSALRARSRGGLSAAAAFLERATEMTPDAARRAQRALIAAETSYLAGTPEAALELLSMATSGPLTEFQVAQANRLRGQIAFAFNRGSEAPPLLLKAARQFEVLDARLARQTYLEVLSAMEYAGRHGTGDELRLAAEATLAAPQASQPPDADDLLLDGLALLITEGPSTAASNLKRAVSMFSSAQTSTDDGMQRLWFACTAAQILWDDENWDVLSTRHVQLARDAGALTLLPLFLTQLGALRLFQGDFAAASSLLDEQRVITEATGGKIPPYAPVALAAFRNLEREAAELIDEASHDVERRGERGGLTLIQYMSALLYNSLGRYELALGPARQAAADQNDRRFSLWAAVEFIEAATRCGVRDEAAEAFERLSNSTRASLTPWALGVEAQSRALLSDAGAADELYREAIGQLAQTSLRLPLARARLLYGEWLRRERRRTDARTQLREAHSLFIAMGAQGFASRAERELLATGETARRRNPTTANELTSRELQITRLARDGLTNPDIGARLFISPRTVQYHLRNAFAKLGVDSRIQLEQVLARETVSGQSIGHDSPVKM